MGKLFGTDGIRGKANSFPITPEMGIKIGRALATFFLKKNEGVKFLIGKDTRISGDMIESSLIAGIASAGAACHLAGILPTPGIAFLTKAAGMDAGIVISASHNPYEDNGIKVFNSEGFKLSVAGEEQIEDLAFNENLSANCQKIHETGQKHLFENPVNRYAHFLQKIVPENIRFADLKIVMDCSNGAAYHVAPVLFDLLEVNVDLIFISPDGKNINRECGSEHPEKLIERVLQEKADVGFALDGDGDRLIAVDEKGEVVTGDQILAISAQHLKQKKCLNNNLVVSTVMSNMGLTTALKNLGIKHVLAKVGDRNVMEQMKAAGAFLGGEDSGHTIFLNHHTTGDGLLAALKLLEIMTESSNPLSELKKVMTVYPQKLINVDVKQKPEITSIPAIVNAIREIENKLGNRGRVLVRYSGTQPCCRVMVEGESLKETTEHCEYIAGIIRNTLGDL